MHVHFISGGITKKKFIMGIIIAGEKNIAVMGTTVFY